MGLLRKASRLHHRIRRVLTSSSRDPGAVPFARSRTCRFEQVEPRRLLAGGFAEIQIGAVYYEDADGQDQGVDRIEIAFSGGVPGTTLTLTATGAQWSGFGTYGQVAIDRIEVQPIPAPGAILLGAIGAGIVAHLRRRRTL